MERIAKLVSRMPPEGLTDWAPVRDSLETWGLVYEAVWVPDTGLEFLRGDEDSAVGQNGPRSRRLWIPSRG